MCYYGIVKKLRGGTYGVPALFIMFGGDGKWDDRKTEDICR